MSSAPMSQIDDSQIERLVSALESIQDGELAVDLLIACGERAIAPLAQMLLQGAARTIALPRCRAVRALGGLGAHRILLAYFERIIPPGDPVVFFSEDAVRSTVAHKLLHWKSDEVFQALLGAATQRATLGIIEALGEFCRSETIPLLFETLEDDLCRNAALDALRKTPGPAHDYAILTIRGKTGVNLIGPAASRRRRATAELLRAIGISREEWLELGDLLLQEEDAEIVVNAAAAGFQVASAEEFPKIVRARCNYRVHSAPKRVAVVNPSSVSIVETIASSAGVGGMQEIAVVSQFAGTAEKFFVKDGEQVQKDQPLAVLKNDVTEQQKVQAERCFELPISSITFRKMK